MQTKKEAMLNPNNEIHLDLNETLERKGINTYRKLKNYLWKNFHIDLDTDSKSENFEDLFYNSDLRSHMGFMVEFGVFVIFPQYYIIGEEWAKMWRRLVRESDIIDEVL
jgi:hypothetical protein